MFDRSSLSALVGEDRRFRRQIERAVRIAPARAPVLVLGESGTGKELVARLLHELGPGAAGPFVAVNCGALSRELAESELFGHERGAFTGADGRRAGWFEEAAGGTLVLDEIGELPLELQPKLLRVLETGRLRRVGGQGEIPVDGAGGGAHPAGSAARGAARAVPHRPLPSAVGVRAGAAAAARAAPPTSPCWPGTFCDELARRARRAARASPRRALAALCRHAWPGNVRELRNVVRRAGDPDAPGPSTPATSSWARRVARAAGRAAARPSRGPAAPRPRTRTRRARLALDGRRFDEMKREIYTWALRAARRQPAARGPGAGDLTLHVLRRGPASGVVIDGPPLTCIPVAVRRTSRR